MGFSELRTGDGQWLSMEWPILAVLAWQPQALGRPLGGFDQNFQEGDEVEVFCAGIARERGLRAFLVFCCPSCHIS